VKTIIAGSRGIDEYQLVIEAIQESGWYDDITEVVSGAASGPDTLGARWANNSKIPVKWFPAQWKLYGKRAGFIRNKEMADYSEALIAVHDGRSRGTQNMIDLATQLGLKVYVKTIS